jgi:transposase
MIQVTPHMQILVACEAVDFRKGIDGLSRICRDVLMADPFSGYVFVFRNKRGTAIKVLVYDGQGFWLCQKRLSTGRFSWWPETQTDTAQNLAVHELQLLLWNGNPKLADVAPMWKKIQ